MNNNDNDSGPTVSALPELRAETSDGILGYILKWSYFGEYDTKKKKKGKKGKTISKNKNVYNSRAYTILCRPRTP